MRSRRSAAAPAVAHADIPVPTWQAGCVSMDAGAQYDAEDADDDSSDGEYVRLHEPFALDERERWAGVATPPPPPPGAARTPADLDVNGGRSPRPNGAPLKRTRGAAGKQKCTPLYPTPRECWEAVQGALRKHREEAGAVLERRRIVRRRRRALATVDSSLHAYASVEAALGREKLKLRRALNKRRGISGHAKFKPGKVYGAQGTKLQLHVPGGADAVAAAEPVVEQDAVGARDTVLGLKRPREDVAKALKVEQDDDIVHVVAGVDEQPATSACAAERAAVRPMGPRQTAPVKTAVARDAPVVVDVIDSAATVNTTANTGGGDGSLPVKKLRRTESERKVLGAGVAKGEDVASAAVILFRQAAAETNAGRPMSGSMLDRLDGSQVLPSIPRVGSASRLRTKAATDIAPRPGHDARSSIVTADWATPPGSGASAAVLSKVKTEPSIARGSLSLRATPGSFRSLDAGCQIGQRTVGGRVVSLGPSLSNPVTPAGGAQSALHRHRNIDGSKLSHSRLTPLVLFGAPDEKRTAGETDGSHVKQETVGNGKKMHAGPTPGATGYAPAGSPNVPVEKNAGAERHVADAERPAVPSAAEKPHAESSETGGCDAKKLCTEDVAGKKDVASETVVVSAPSSEPGIEEVMSKSLKLMQRASEDFEEIDAMFRSRAKRFLYQLRDLAKQADCPTSRPLNFTTLQKDFANVRKEEDAVESQLTNERMESIGVYIQRAIDPICFPELSKTLMLRPGYRIHGGPIDVDDEYDQEPLRHESIVLPGSPNGNNTGKLATVPEEDENGSLEDFDLTFDAPTPRDSPVPRSVARKPRVSPGGGRQSGGGASKEGPRGVAGESLKLSRSAASGRNAKKTSPAAARADVSRRSADASQMKLAVAEALRSGHANEKADREAARLIMAASPGVRSSVIATPTHLAAEVPAQEGGKMRNDNNNPGLRPVPKLGPTKNALPANANGALGGYASPQLAPVGRKTGVLALARQPKTPDNLAGNSAGSELGACDAKGVTAAEQRVNCNLPTGVAFPTATPSASSVQLSALVSKAAVLETKIPAGIARHGDLNVNLSTTKPSANQISSSVGTGQAAEKSMTEAPRTEASRSPAPSSFVASEGAGVSVPNVSRLLHIDGILSRPDVTRQPFIAASAQSVVGRSLSVPAPLSEVLRASLVSPGVIASVAPAPASKSTSVEAIPRTSAASSTPEAFVSSSGSAKPTPGVSTPSCFATDTGATPVAAIGSTAKPATVGTTSPTLNCGTLTAALKVNVSHQTPDTVAQCKDVTMGEAVSGSRESLPVVNPGLGSMFETVVTSPPPGLPPDATFKSAIKTSESETCSLVAKGSAKLAGSSANPDVVPVILDEEDNFGAALKSDILSVRIPGASIDSSGSSPDQDISERGPSDNPSASKPFCANVQSAGVTPVSSQVHSGVVAGVADTVVLDATTTMAKAEEQRPEVPHVTPGVAEVIDLDSFPDVDVRGSPN